MLMNIDEKHHEPQAFRFSCDSAHWIPCPSGGYEIKSYDIGGNLWRLKTLATESWAGALYAGVAGCIFPVTQEVKMETPDESISERAGKEGVISS